MAWQQRRNEFTDIRGFFYPLITSFFRGSQPFWKENLISDSFHLVIASLANLKVLETLFCTAVGVSGNLWQNRGNKGADIDTENVGANCASVLDKNDVCVCEPCGHICIRAGNTVQREGDINKGQERGFVQDVFF